VAILDTDRRRLAAFPALSAISPLISPRALTETDNFDAHAGVFAQIVSHRRRISLSAI
jgi:hypothetical protein